VSTGSGASSYEILAKLAEGGMAEIFIARNATGAGVERICVLKRLLPHLAGNTNLAEMFIREARLAAQLQHPNVAQVYDVGMLGSSYFFTMEYVHGETVRDLMLLARGMRQRIPFGTVLSIAAGAAAGLHHAHERRGIDGTRLGIVHCDLSPANVLVSREGIVKLVDFGGTIRKGSSYLSPEQCHGAYPVDRRSDLFSLGVMLWELLTLQGLYRRNSDAENMAAIQSEITLPPSQFRKDVPPELDQLVMRLLAKIPEDRFATAAQLLEAIEGLALRLGTPLSVAGLARTMHDWFGERAEPWLEATSGGKHKRLVVSSEPVPAKLGKALGAPVDDALNTLKPTTPVPDDIPGDTIPDGTPGETLEQLRDRLFKEAKQRKTPVPEADPEDARATIPRIPVDKVIMTSRREEPLIVHSRAPAPAHPTPPPMPRHPGAQLQPYAEDRPRSPWLLVVLALSVIALSSGLVFLLSN
jgi:eukaryotic-like serine/threonine-protein kinase